MGEGGAKQALIDLGRLSNQLLHGFSLPPGLFGQDLERSTVVIGLVPPEALRDQAEDHRATLEVLAEQSRRQREAMEKLVGESAKVYESLLSAPFSHHQHHPEFEEATGAPEVNR